MDTNFNDAEIMEEEPVMQNDSLDTSDIIDVEINENGEAIQVENSEEDIDASLEEEREEHDAIDSMFEEDSSADEENLKLSTEAVIHLLGVQQRAIGAEFVNFSEIVKNEFSQSLHDRGIHLQEEAKNALIRNTCIKQILFCFNVFGESVPHIMASLSAKVSATAQQELREDALVEPIKALVLITIANYKNSRLKKMHDNVNELIALNMANILKITGMDLEKAEEELFGNTTIDSKEFKALKSVFKVSKGTFYSVYTTATSSHVSAEDVAFTYAMLQTLFEQESCKTTADYGRALKTFCEFDANKSENVKLIKNTWFLQTAYSMAKGLLDLGKTDGKLQATHKIHALTNNNVILNARSKITAQAALTGSEQLKIESSKQEYDTLLDSFDSEEMQNEEQYILASSVKNYARTDETLHEIGIQNATELPHVVEAMDYVSSRSANGVTTNAVTTKCVCGESVDISNMLTEFSLSKPSEFSMASYNAFSKSGITYQFHKRCPNCGQMIIFKDSTYKEINSLLYRFILGNKDDSKGNFVGDNSSNAQEDTERLFRYGTGTISFSQLKKIEDFNMYNKLDVAIDMKGDLADANSADDNFADYSNFAELVHQFDKKLEAFKVDLSVNKSKFSMDSLRQLAHPELAITQDAALLEDKQGTELSLEDKKLNILHNMRNTLNVEENKRYYHNFLYWFIKNNYNIPVDAKDITNYALWYLYGDSLNSYFLKEIRSYRKDLKRSKIYDVFKHKMIYKSGNYNSILKNESTSLEDTEIDDSVDLDANKDLQQLLFDTWNECDTKNERSYLESLFIGSYRQAFIETYMADDIENLQDRVEKAFETSIDKFIEGNEKSSLSINVNFKSGILAYVQCISDLTLAMYNKDNGSVLDSFEIRDEESGEFITSNIQEESKKFSECILINVVNYIATQDMFDYSYVKLPKALTLDEIHSSSNVSKKELTTVETFEAIQSIGRRVLSDKLTDNGKEEVDTKIEEFVQHAMQAIKSQQKVNATLQFLSMYLDSKMPDANSEEFNAFYEKPITREFLYLLQYHYRFIVMSSDIVDELSQTDYIRKSVLNEAVVTPEDYTDDIQEAARKYIDMLNGEAVKNKEVIAETFSDTLLHATLTILYRYNVRLHAFCNIQDEMFKLGRDTLAQEVDDNFTNIAFAIMSEYPLIIDSAKCFNRQLTNPYKQSNKIKKPNGKASVKKPPIGYDFKVKYGKRAIDSRQYCEMFRSQLVSKGKSFNPDALLDILWYNLNRLDTAAVIETQLKFFTEDSINYTNNMEEQVIAATYATLTEQADFAAIFTDEFSLPISELDVDVVNLISNLDLDGVADEANIRLENAKLIDANVIPISCQALYENILGLTSFPEYSDHYVDSNFREEPNAVNQCISILYRFCFTGTEIPFMIQSGKVLK